MKIYTLVLFSALLLSCSDGKKQVLEAEADKSKTLNADITTQLMIDTVKPKLGIKYKETRASDLSNPPIVLRLDAPQTKKEFDLADYYSSVQYVMLDFPHQDEFVGFLGDASYKAIEGDNAWSGSGINSEALINEESIIAGDNYLGYYQYDENGKFLKDIIKPETFPEFDKVKNQINLEYDENSNYMIGKAQSFGDMFIFSQRKNKKAFTSYYSKHKQDIYYSSYIQWSVPIPINENHVVALRYNPTATKQEPIIYSFSMKGDTLCRFMNYNPLLSKEIKSAYANPETFHSYYLGEQLNFRQPYNDTIYAFKSAYELNPRYVLSYSQNKPSVETALRGNKAGKYFIDNIKESPAFLYIVYTSDYDCPNNRNNGSVKFHYSLYDKKEKKLYQISENIFPEDFVVKNGISDGIPVDLSQLKAYKNKMYLSYTKSQLKQIIESKQFTKYPSLQQQKVKSLHDQLPEGGLLVAIFE